MNHVKGSIALISDHGDPAASIGFEEAGGQNIYVRHIGERLAKLGWHVDMFTRKVNPAYPEIVTHSPRCRTIRLSAGPQQFIPRDEIFGHLPEFTASLENFQRTKRIRYRLLHTHYWLSAWVGLEVRRKNDNIRLAHTHHSLGAIKYQHVQPRPAIGPMRLKIEKRILQQADCVIATSPQEKEYMRMLVSERGRIDVIPCGVDTRRFRPQPKIKARAHLQIDPAVRLVLYVGRFDPRKGIDTLVHACANLLVRRREPFQLFIVGGSNPGGADGRERKRIEEIVREERLVRQTMFVGRIGHDMLPEYYAAADVCVVPSYYEPFGMVALEAMACGIPVVASAVGGLNFTILPDKTGILVPPENTTALAAALERILSDDPWALSLGANAAVFVRQNFTWKIVTTRLNKLYEELID